MINIIQTNGNTVKVISRDTNKKRITYNITMPPYFYAQHKEGECISLFGDTVKKVTVKNSWEVKDMRGEFNSFESDILFVNRVLIDKFDKIDDTPIRIMYFDMENKHSLDVHTAPKPITCISTYDNFLKCYNTFVWRKDLIEDKKTFYVQEENKLTVENTGIKVDSTSNIKHNVFYFNNENSMVKKWLLFIKSTDPDIFQGWNLLGFDWIYIINRCKRLNIDINTISYGCIYSDVTYRMREPWNEVTIPGRYVFDTLRAYKESKFKELDSYSLNDVAKEELKDVKIEVEDFEEVWLTDINKLIERCRKDVELVKRIDENSGLFEFYNEFRKEIGCRWEDMWNTTIFHDVSFLRQAKEDGVILPRKLHLEREKTKGGFVHDPVAGRHENTIVLDLKSLYPIIIQTFNISPETVSPIGELSIKTPWGSYNFSLEKEGICSKVARKMLEKRVTYKKEMKKHHQDTPEYKKWWSRQEAMKRAANKIFGALANPHFRLYRIECARAITSFGQFLNKYSTKKAIELGKGKIDVIYGDTDSIFIKVKGIYTKEELEEYGKMLAKKITESYQEVVNEHFKSTKHITPKSLFEIEYECIYTSLFFRGDEDKVAKKRYCADKWLRDNNGEWEYKYEVKGFETVRTDSAIVERITMDQIYQEILKGKDKEYIHSIVDETKKTLIEGKLNFDELCLRKGKNIDSKQDIYTHAAKYGNKYLGTHFDKYCKLKILYVYRVPNLPLPTYKEKAVAYENEQQLLKVASKEEWMKCINWSKQFERLFDTKIRMIDSSMEWNKKEKGKQTGLF